MPENVALHPTWAKRLQRCDEPPPPIHGTTATGAIVLGLVAMLHRRARETGGEPMMLALLQEAERFAAPGVELRARYMVGRLWDQLALEAAARSTRKPKGTRDAPR